MYRSSRISGMFHWGSAVTEKLKTTGLQYEWNKLTPCPHNPQSKANKNFEPRKRVLIS